MDRRPVFPFPPPAVIVWLVGSRRWPSNVTKSRNCMRNKRKIAMSLMISKIFLSFFIFLAFIYEFAKLSRFFLFNKFFLFVQFVLFYFICDEEGKILFLDCDFGEASKERNLNFFSSSFHCFVNGKLKMRRGMFAEVLSLKAANLELKKECKKWSQTRKTNDIFPKIFLLPAN